MKLYDRPCPKCGNPAKDDRKCEYCDYDPDTQTEEDDDAPESGESPSAGDDESTPLERHEWESGDGQDGGTLPDRPGEADQRGPAEG